MIIKAIAFAAGMTLAATSHAKENRVAVQNPLYFSSSTIPHEHQRYDTVGDWKFEGHHGIRIKVSDMADERYVFLVALHELVEAYLCKVRGISEGSVTAFDTGYEDRADSLAGEPGDDPRAPYHKEHVFASKIERMMADELGVNWNAYNDAVEALGK